MSRRPDVPSTEPVVSIDQIDAQTFTLSVTVDGQRFDCGNYLTRMAAVEAGRQFVRRKEGERAGRKSRPRSPGKAGSAP
ncbi:MAG: hypothetical protein P4M00_04730 [Azospirillaceae bacterium]|nr:hypothetical protein [Azospirillaceae bacterium]